MAIAKIKKKSVRAARLDIRLNPKAKEKIEQAAVVSHQTVTDFVVTSLMRASEEALRFFPTPAILPRRMSTSVLASTPRVIVSTVAFLISVSVGDGVAVRCACAVETGKAIAIENNRS